MTQTSQQAAEAQKQQLISGLRSDDKNIFFVSTGREEYSPSYARRKGKSRPIDLYLTGAFNEGVFAQASEEGMFFDSGDSKSAMLQDDDHFGEKIFGLGTGARIDWFDSLRPATAFIVAAKLNQAVNEHATL